MSKYFVKPTDVVVIYEKPEENQHLPRQKRDHIVVRAKMDFDTLAKVQDELLNIQLRMDAQGEETGQDFEAQVSVPSYNVALLRHNIVKWGGPGFHEEAVDEDGNPLVDEEGNPALDDDGTPPLGEKFPCTYETKGTLDPTEPFIQRVLARIVALNKAHVAPPSDNKDKPDPKDRVSSVSVKTGG